MACHMDHVHEQVRDARRQQLKKDHVIPRSTLGGTSPDGTLFEPEIDRRIDEVYTLRLVLAV